MVETTCEAVLSWTFSLGFVCLLLFFFFLLIQCLYWQLLFLFSILPWFSLGRLCILRFVSSSRLSILLAYFFIVVTYDSLYFYGIVVISPFIDCLFVLILAKGLAILFVYRESTVNWIDLFFLSMTLSVYLISVSTLCVVAVLFLITLGIRSGFYWGDFFFFAS